MASCLNPACSCSRAKVLYSRTMRTSDGRRECWRITQCPPADQGGCGQRRRQTIHDEGETPYCSIEPEVRAKPSRGPARGHCPRGDASSV